MWNLHVVFCIIRSVRDHEYRENVSTTHTTGWVVLSDRIPPKCIKLQKRVLHIIQQKNKRTEQYFIQEAQICLKNKQQPEAQYYQSKY